MPTVLGACSRPVKTGFNFVPALPLLFLFFPINQSTVFEPTDPPDHAACTTDTFPGECGSVWVLEGQNFQPLSVCERFFAASAVTLKFDS